ncbi:dihydrolipoamide acetyltransferase family protein [Cohnella nanjingensis]|uniref:Dihydrolipoamide acetyltransferase component of pyruvate dehydrogenase complex n=1 Tax=Cohnella nanjingensis TaxID=1387779 RepID=A0A7X0VE97_9BACL|nr:dihydrolipoamide acetyltransferase family protein [Cohnella nanjingensis]MBB6670777.1 2-oxo acid dehydrogenase subunit E2 [Cohnella nanjingensis]
MATNIVIPSLGLTMEEGIIVEWLAKDGERVEKEEAVLLIETDKATAEVVAPATGILGGIVAQVGEAFPVGVKVATIYATHEEYEADHNTETSRGSTEGETPAAEVPAIEQPADPIRLEPRMPAPPSEREVRIKASPAAKKLAGELGIPLADVAGTGPGGRILESNVALHAKGATDETPPHPKSAFPVAAPTAAPRAEPQAVSAMRKTIARRMVQSKLETAPVTIFMEARMDEAINLRERLNDGLREQGGSLKLTYDAIFAKTVALAMKNHPHMQAQWVDDKLIYPGGVHVGVAVSLPDGLVVPVVRDADSRSLMAIAADISRLALEARAGKLKPDDMRGGTVTISNLGMYPVTGFTPVINLPEACILGIGSVQEKAIAVDGALTIGRVAVLSLTFDHRVTDGAPAAAFLTEFKSIVERPYRLFLEH